MQDLISVIVPIYKVEKYLPKCLDSILNQTYRNLEIILIDDGSPDGCPEICDEYTKRDARIKVIHQENGGLSMARNSGLDIANGNFIAFVDSDDYLHKQMYEDLYRNLKEYGADISVCGFQYIFEKDIDIEKYSYNHKTPQPISVYSGREALGNLYGNLEASTLAPWNKLYKKELFENLRFETGKIHEEQFILHRIFDKAKKVVYSDSPMYYYLQRNSSILGQYTLKRLDVLEALEERMTYFLDKGYEDLSKKAYDQFLSRLIDNYYMVEKFFPKKKVVIRDLKNKFLDAYKCRNDLKLSKKSIFKYRIFSISPFLYKMVSNLWGLYIKQLIVKVRLG